MNNVNYLQIVPLTWEERFKLYMKNSKKELATMLAERDKIDFPEGCAECRKNEQTAVNTSASTMTIYYGDERN